GPGREAERGVAAHGHRVRPLNDQREFLLSVDYSPESDDGDRAWVRVRLLDEWDFVDSEVEQLRGWFAGMFTTRYVPEFFVLSLDRRAHMNTTIWGNGGEHYRDPPVSRTSCSTGALSGRRPAGQGPRGPRGSQLVPTCPTPGSPRSPAMTLRPRRSARWWPRRGWP